MGISDSKIVSKKVEKTVIKCPIETTEIIASDCESIVNNQLVKQKIFSVSDVNTLTTHQSIDSISNLSFFNSDNFRNPIDQTNENKKRPLIQNINSKIELLDISLSDHNLSLDDFSSTEPSTENRTSSDEQSVESQSLLSNNSSSNASEHSKSNNSLSEDSHICFNKGFLDSFKERYSKNRSPLSVNKLKNQILEKKNVEGDDSFTEITNMLPNENHRSLNNSKDREIKLVKDMLVKNSKTEKDSDRSATNNSLRISENFKDKQVRSVPLAKLDMSNSLCTSKMVNSLSTKLNNCKPGFNCLCYKFWVDATFDTWKVFHNPRDRRIESIGRLSNCQIRLTKITQRSSKGMLKRQVFIYASSLSSLEKCCKLFDDKFANFCASSGLNMDTSI